MVTFTFTFHGAAYEVGRSCIELAYAGSDNRPPKRILMDCGIKIIDDDESVEDGYPTPVRNLQEIDAVFISHAHLDHIGSLPYFVAQGLNCPIFMNKLTKELTTVLLNDSFGISQSRGMEMGYSEPDIQKALAMVENIEMYNEKDCVGIPTKYYDAGHIPGSSSMVLTIGGKRILYTADIHTDETHLLHGTAMQYSNIDVMIVESTYGDRNHPDRHKEEKEFLDEVKHTVAFGGSVLIPVFGVGRAQEVLMMLNQRQIGVPVYLDGMAKKVTHLYLKYPGSLKDAQKLQNALDAATQVGGWKERKEFTKTQGIFVTTAGMMGGGPVLDYIRRLHFDTKNAVFLTGYQSDNSNGRMLLDTGKVVVDDDELTVRGKVRKFDFSAHAGMSGLKKLIKKVNPKVLILQHGDPSAIDNLKEWCDFCEVYAPHVDEPIEVDL